MTHSPAAASTGGTEQIDANREEPKKKVVVISPKTKIIDLFFFF
jgi:hypothetical protein